MDSGPAGLGTFNWTQRDFAAFDAPTTGTNDGVIQHISWWERVWAEDAVAADALITLGSTA